MSKIEIYIATHKKTKMPNNKIYFPLHVGSKGKNDFGYVKDSTGDNISERNPNFCELTGLYWIWKNSNADIVGLVHYRRYFYKNVFCNKKNILNESTINKFLNNYDIIVAPKGYTWGSTVKTKYIENHVEADLIKCEKVLKEKYPEYSHAFDKVLNGNCYMPFNMMIAKKEIFDEYSKWLFDILFELEKIVDVEDGRSNYDKRVFGFLSERLLYVWLLKNNQYKVKELFVMNKEENTFRQRCEYIIKKIIK